jgi:UDP-glucose 4-epimerase
VIDLVAIIGEVAGHAVEPQFTLPRPGELPRSAVAVERAARDLRWWPGMPLADGIRAVFQWIEAGTPDRADC